MYHPIAATCPSDMVVRVRKVLANRGLLRGCVVWPFGPGVRELKGMDLRTEPLRTIFLFIPQGLLNSFSVIVLVAVYSLWLQVMWFSSGGTKSVLHLDDGLDNINCLFRGTKELLFIDYQKYKHVVR